MVGSTTPSDVRKRLPNPPANLRPVSASDQSHPTKNSHLVKTHHYQLLGPNLGLGSAQITAYTGLMQILPISKLKDKLNEFVDAVTLTKDQVTITKNGSPAAVLIGFEEWESLQETLYWLSQPGIRDAIAEADADIAAGKTYGEDEIRSEFGVPQQHRS
jgi:antitoxin YefM